MNSLLEKLKAGKRNIKVIRFPGTDQDVALRVLSNAERQDALFAADNVFKKQGIEISVATVEAFEDENATQILARALRDPQNADRPFADNADELRGLVTLSEKDILIEEYNAFEKEVSPSEEILTDDELDNLFEDLKKTPDIGNGLSTHMLRRLIVYLASRP